MAAPREVIVVLLDVGATMSRRGQSTKLVEDCVQGISRLIEKKILFYPKDLVGLVLFGTNGTNNRIAASVPGCYQHVSVVAPIKAPNVTLLKRLLEVKPENANSDFVDALIVGIDLLASVEPKKGVGTNMRLFLVTDAAGEVNAADLEQIISKMEELKISLNVVGVDFAEHDPTGPKEPTSPSSSGPQVKSELGGDTTVKSEKQASVAVKPENWSQPTTDDAKKDPSLTSGTKQEAAVSLPDPQQLRKIRNEGVLKLICSRVRGIIVPVHEALDLMSFFSSRSVTSHPSLRTFLDIGGIIKIPVWTYLKTKELSMPRLVSISKLSSEMGSERVEAKEGEVKPEGIVVPTMDQSMGVAIQRTYVAMDNPDEEVPPEARTRGYKYGKKYVPAVNTIIPYSSEPCLKLIGFTPEASVPRHFYTSNTEEVVPYFRDDSAAQAISALCHAMARTGMVGIVRMVKRKNSAPILGVISPHIGELTETLYLNRLPFNDDLRLYGFTSLVETESTPNVPKYAIPTERQLNVTEDLINSMDLSEAATSTLGEPMEALKPKHTFNPTLQYFYKVILSRALKPNMPIPPLDTAIVQHVSMDASKLAAAGGSMQRFHDAFVLTKTENKEKENRKRFWSEAFSGEAVDEKLESYLGDDAKKAKKKEDSGPGGVHNIHTLLRGGVETVGNLTPVEDFKAMLSRRDLDLVDKAITEIQTQILRFINDSYKNSHYEKALECIDALRVGCVKEQESDQFNQFLQLIKTTYKDKQRHDFWQAVQQKAINLISTTESDDSEVTLEQVRDFYASDAVPQEVLSVGDAPNAPEKSSGTAEDLFDLLG